MSYFGEFQRIIREHGTVWYLGQKNIATFLESVGLVLDGSVDGFMRGLNLSRPLRCDKEAFPALSKDRKRPLYPYEPEASKRERLRKWRQLARSDASAYGAMINLQPYFLSGTLPTIYIVHQSGDPGSGPIATWHTLGADGSYSWYRPVTSNFNYGHPEKWSEWYAFVDLTSLGIVTGNVWDDSHTYNDGALYDGLGLGVGQAGDIVQILLDSNPPHAWLAGVFFIVGPGFDITATPTQDVSGWWNLPNGAGTWSNVINRPPYIVTAYDNPAP